MQKIPTHFGQVFVGLAIIALDLRAGRFDILPDFVGYILVALGAGGLAGLAGSFNVARLAAWVLVPVSVVGILFQGYFGMIVRILHLPLDGILVWFLLGGVMEIALNKQRSDLAGRASLCRIAYVALLGVIGLILVIGRALPSVASALGTLTSVATLCLVGVILHLLYRVKQVTTAAEQPPATEQDLPKAA